MLFSILFRFKDADERWPDTISRAHGTASRTVEGNMKLSDTIKKVIPLAEAIHDYWEIELPKRYRDYPFVHEGEEEARRRRRRRS